jgi:polysaccharide export outer membrane protein
MNNRRLHLALTLLLPVLLWGCSEPVAKYSQDNPYSLYEYTNPSKTGGKPSAGIPDEVLHRYFLVGIGDVLNVRIFEKWPYYGNSPIQEVTVRTDGTIMVSPVGKIKVTGLSVLEIEKLLLQQLKELLNIPMCEVRLVKSENSRVVIYHESGGDQKTNYVDLTRPVRLTELIAQIGGISLNDDPTNVKILGRTGEVNVLNLDDIVFRNHLEKDIFLKPGDIIYIPTSTFSRVYVLGEVRNPGLVKLGHQNTLLDIVSLAGGPTELAFLPTVAVVRPSDQGPKVFSVNMKAIVRGGKMDNNLILAPGDLVYVPKSALGKTEQILRVVSMALNIFLPSYLITRQLMGSP